MPESRTERYQRLIRENSHYGKFELQPYQRQMVEAMAARRTGRTAAMHAIVEQASKSGQKVIDASTGNAATYVPENRQGWWGGPDTRLRCSADHKVVFADQAAAERSASKATERGQPMHAYQGKCGHWHTSRTRRKTR